MRTPAPVKFILPRVVSVFFASMLLIVAGSAAASAATPTTWQDPEPTSFLHELLFYGGSLLGLIAFLVLFSLTIHRNNYVAPRPSAELEHKQAEVAQKS